MRKNAARARRLTGTIVGRLAGLDAAGAPVVDYPGNPGAPLVARSIVALRPEHIGGDVALAFDGGDADRPLLLGVLKPTPAEAQVDGERIVLNGREEVVLRCGKASITLTRAGKILLRGAYVSSRSSGVNRIKGGSVHIN